MPAVAAVGVTALPVGQVAVVDASPFFVAAERETGAFAPHLIRVEQGFGQAAQADPAAGRLRQAMFVPAGKNFLHRAVLIAGMLPTLDRDALAGLRPVVGAAMMLDADGVAELVNHRATCEVGDLAI